ncbi:MAG: hypothetical protein FWG08_01845 [Propionibacteriaceae bacterium]|nr:hypothetical protein [Propionibacteriaceae bacterium]
MSPINEAYDHPPGSMWVSILATVDNPPPVQMFGKDDYEAALSYRDGVLGS